MKRRWIFPYNTSACRTADMIALLDRLRLACGAGETGPEGNCFLGLLPAEIRSELLLFFVSAEDRDDLFLFALPKQVAPPLPLPDQAQTFLHPGVFHRSFRDRLLVVTSASDRYLLEWDEVERWSTWSKSNNDTFRAKSAMASSKMAVARLPPLPGETVAHEIKTFLDKVEWHYQNSTRTDLSEHDKQVIYSGRNAAENVSIGAGKLRSFLAGVEDNWPPFDLNGMPFHENLKIIYKTRCVIKCRARMTSEDDLVFLDAYLYLPTNEK